jgi:hypothetical protein
MRLISLMTYLILLKQHFFASILLTDMTMQSGLFSNNLVNDEQKIFSQNNLKRLFL